MDNNQLPLVLGTAQLGMDYGVANRSGKPELSKAREIVSLAWEQGIRFFDTAQTYGQSESVLGISLRDLIEVQGREGPAVISKLQPDIDPSNGPAVFKAVEETIKRLGLKSLWGLLLHRESWLDSGTESFNRVVDRLKRNGMIKYFGVSVYSPEKAVTALNMHGIDLVQLPFNVLDQRALRYGVFELARQKNKTVFVRSVYLQGLLLLDPNDLPFPMSYSRNVLSQFHRAAKEFGLSSKLLALSYAVCHAKGAMIVIGVEEPFQMKENVELFRIAQQVLLPDLSFLSQEDPRLINPGLWPS